MLKKECCKQCRYVKFKGTMTKWPIQKQTHRTTQKHVEHQDATDIQKKQLIVVHLTSLTSLFILSTYKMWHENKYNKLFLWWPGCELY